MAQLRVLVVMSLLGLAGPALAEEQPAQPQPYAKYDKLLKRYVNDSGMVDYAAWKKKDERALRDCVAEMASHVGKVDSWSKKERLAYWINVYNAVMLQAMLELHPVKSVLKVKKDGKAFDIFKRYPFSAKKLTLDSIEHKILRKMGDPRIHSAIVCASKGCPPLRNEAYVASRLDEQLNDNCQDWFGSPTRGLRVRGKVVYLSQIFNWFKEDFGGSVQQRLWWIVPFIKDVKTRTLLLSGRAKVRFIDWDWTTNKQ